MQELSSVGQSIDHHCAASFGDSDLTDIYLYENLQDYIFVIFPATIPKNGLFQVLKCENVLSFLPYNKVNIFGIWLLVGQTKTFDEVITYYRHFSLFSNGL